MFLLSAPNGLPTIGDVVPHRSMLRLASGTIAPGLALGPAGIRLPGGNGLLRLCGVEAFRSVN
ncbi:hypothetical protein OH492_14560 [Vibrio chagasii]|nr:hypothetical protein [Vibrio chagasii]